MSVRSRCGVVPVRYALGRSDAPGGAAFHAEGWPTASGRGRRPGSLGFENEGDPLTRELGGLGDIELHRLAGTPLALAMLRSAMGASDTHLEVRVRYELPTDNDGVLDQLRMGTRNTSEGAVLEVVIQP